MTQQPAFHTLALRDIPRPDYGDVALAVLPPYAGTDPAEWALRLFSADAMPNWVSGAMQLRQALAPLIGVTRAPRDVFKVSERSGEEALISIRDRHLDCCIAVGIDSETRIMRVTTTVRLKGWRGRLYFAVVRPLHPLVLHAMLKKSIRTLPHQP